MTPRWHFADGSHRVVTRVWPDGRIDSCLADTPAVTADPRPPLEPPED